MSRKDRKTPFDKFSDFLLRPATPQQDGKPFPEAYPGDFCSHVPVAQFIGQKKIPLPPGTVYDVREYGAVPNDRQRLATLGINYAISLCAENSGGTVLISGGDFYCSTLELKSGVTLLIEKGARLIASRDPSSYPERALLYGKGLQDITITGGGELCGEGTFFSCCPESQPITEAPAVIDTAELERAARKQSRSMMKGHYGCLIRFDDCSDITVEHLVLKDSADTAICFLRCDRVHIAHCVIDNNRHIAKAGGIALVGTSHAELEHTFISAGGEGVRLQNPLWMDCRMPMGHIAIKNCEIMTPKTAVSVGDDTTADIFDIAIENCYFHLDDIFPGMMSGVTVASCDGALVCDVIVRDVRMDGVTCPLFVRLSNRNKAAEISMADLPDWDQPKDVILPAAPERFDWRGSVRRVLFENISAENAELPIVLAGVKEGMKGTRYIEQITLSAVEISYCKRREIYDWRLRIPEYGKAGPLNWRFGNLPAYGIWARHVKGLHVRDFRCVPAKSTWKQCYIYDDVK